MCADLHEDSPGSGSVSGGPGRASATRQQRVGILRNPNRAPMPPPRRAQLTGKWFSLRSSRRAAPAHVECAEQAVATKTKPSDSMAERAGTALKDTAQPAPAMKSGPDGGTEMLKPKRSVDPDAALDGRPEGSSARIDIARLAEEVADIGEKKSRRRRYGEGVAPVGAPSGKVVGARVSSRHDDMKANDGETPRDKAARRDDPRQDSILPALADPIDDHEAEIARGETAHTVAAGKNIGARILRGVLLFCLAGLAIAAMITLPRA